MKISSKKLTSLEEALKEVHAAADTAAAHPGSMEDLDNLMGIMSHAVQLSLEALGVERKIAQKLVELTIMQAGIYYTERRRIEANESI